ncbi:NAD(P)/FAD-dependent oxidoreductase [Fretibacter rubidus]|uniref:NAD(P)/FAD-dependent oxidoreductase n=1 Tax=Fretibacter rubidus TaxID=570162 RepID=UPI00352A901A
MKHTADYLIVGSGAVGMAFADVLLTETDATMIIVDRFAKPGGHWNVAYPFVTLHQPSAYYGVSSRELGTGRLETDGLNKGLSELATGAEISAYFDAVMREQFIPSGRVQYFPMCDYQGDGHFINTVSGQTHHATVTKMVDATHLKTTVPSTHTPNFDVAPDVRFMPLNDLPTIDTPPDGFVVIGTGKTGIDAVLWLLQNDVSPDDIRWIMPRDAWLLDRANTQPDPSFFHQTMEAQAAQMESIAQAESVPDMFDRLEACGYFVRIDTDVRPQMFHGATISQAELAALRRVKHNIIRLGRVSSITERVITLEHGTIATTANTVHVDCSARAISNMEIKPIFDGHVITPQMVRSYQPVFSAAFIAHIEATYDDETEKNRLCGVVPLPNHDTDYLRFTAAFMMNQYNWGQDKALRKWLRGNRLDGFSDMVASIAPEDTDKIAVMTRIKDNSFPAMGKLQAFLAALGG